MGGHNRDHGVGGVQAFSQAPGKNNIGNVVADKDNRFAARPSKNFLQTPEPPIRGGFLFVVIETLVTDDGLETRSQTVLIQDLFNVLRGIGRTNTLGVM